MIIKVMKLGEQSKSVDVPAGTTVQGALQAANLPIDGYTISRNGIGTSLGADVSAGDILLLSQKVTGGLR